MDGQRCATASCLFLHDYVQYDTRGPEGTDLVLYMWSVQGSSGETVREHTKPFTPIACGGDSSHGLSQPAPLHLSTHPLWNQSPRPTIAMQNTPPALNTISIILNHLPLPPPPPPFPQPPSQARPLLSLLQWINSCHCQVAQNANWEQMDPLEQS